MASKDKIVKFGGGLPVLKFSTNWNFKLCNDAFTTIRLWNPTKFIIGSSYQIVLDMGKVPTVFGEVKVWDGKKFRLEQLNDYMAWLDTGYDAKDCRGILRTMYKNLVKDVETADFGYYLLVKQFQDGTEANTGNAYQSDPESDNKLKPTY